MKNRKIAGKALSWFWLVIGLLYFFVPLISTFIFSLHGKKGVLSFVAYEHVFADPKFIQSFLFSLQMSVYTILVGLVLIVPTTILINLKLPKIKPVIELFSLLPMVIPPVILAFGLIRFYANPPLMLVASPALLVAGYVVISFPYIYRSVDTGLTSMDLKVLTEAAQSLGAGWLSILFRVILPNLMTALLSATFLTFATVIGELTMAVLLAWPAFGPYMAHVGRDLAYEPAALAILSFLMTWGSIGLIQLFTRGISGSGPSSKSEFGGIH